MGRSRHVVILGLVVVCAVAMFPGSAGAAIYGVYSGSLSVAGGGLTAYDGWRASDTSAGATLSWQILWNDVDKLWGYNYTLSNVGGKDVSHFLIEASADDPRTGEVEGFTDEDLGPYKPGLEAPEIKGYDAEPWDENKTLNEYISNPYLPDDLYGIKFNTEGYNDRNSLWFWTARTPVWGDFYAKDGTGTVDGSTEWAVAYNQGFGIDPTGAADPDWWYAPEGAAAGKWATGVPDSYEGLTGWTLNSTGDRAWNYVLRPDTLEDPGGDGFGVPEPNLGLLLLLGMIPVGIGVRLRRARKQS